MMQKETIRMIMPNNLGRQYSLHAEEYKRSVYLPAGNWKNINDGKVYKGGKSYVVNAPIDCIPVFKKA